LGIDKLTKISGTTKRNTNGNEEELILPEQHYLLEILQGSIIYRKSLFAGTTPDWHPDPHSLQNYQYQQSTSK